MFEVCGELKNDLEFEKSDTSFLDLGHGDLYIGSPFIIGGSGEKDDKPILSFITSIEAGDIEYFNSRKYQEYIIKKETKTGNKNKQILVDLDGDTSVIPKEIVKIEDKQKYLALNWLPYFLVEKNNFYKIYRTVMK
ncbi:MAG: hypothetical protein Q9M97_09240 [Candidatus Gracilibacteria bacterium]|nr:hypothetical protein [Candidatus Gracilibacteria bacterium]